MRKETMYLQPYHSVGLYIYIYTDWNTKTVPSIEADILWDCTNLSHHLISSPKYWRLIENLTTLLSMFFLDWEGIYKSTMKRSTQEF